MDELPIIVEPREYVGDVRTGEVFPIGAIEHRGPQNSFYVRAFIEPCVCKDGDHPFHYMKDEHGQVALSSNCLN